MWTLLVLPLAGCIIYDLYRNDVQTSFDMQLKKLLTVLTLDSMNTTGDEPVRPNNQYEPLFEVTHSGWYWQIRPIDGAAGRRLVSPSLASETLPSPYDKKFPTDDDRHALDRTCPAPTAKPSASLEVIDTPGTRSRQDEVFDHRRGSAWSGSKTTVKKFRNRLTTALALVGLGLLGVTLFQVRFGLLPLRRIEKGLAAHPLGRCGQAREQPPRRDRAAAERTQRADPIQHGHRRAGAHAGRQSGACA